MLLKEICAFDDLETNLWFLNFQSTDKLSSLFESGRALFYEHFSIQIFPL